MTELITKMTPTGIRDESKVIIKNIVKSLQIYGFWCVIIIMIGFYLGVSYCNITRKDDMKKSIALKAFIYESKVYEIKERLLQ